MITNPDDNWLERQVRQRLARGDAPGDCPSALVLAAYLDGRSPPPEVESVEDHLVRCPACLATVRDVRRLGREIEGQPVLVPAHIGAAARGLVEPRPRPAVRPGGLRFPGWPALGRWGLAAAASLVICATGYRTGLAAFSAGEAASDELAAEMSFGLLDPSDSAASDLALFALALPEGSR